MLRVLYIAVHLVAKTTERVTARGGTRHEGSGACIGGAGLSFDSRTCDGRGFGSVCGYDSSNPSLPVSAGLYLWGSPITHTPQRIRPLTDKVSSSSNHLLIQIFKQGRGKICSKNGDPNRDLWCPSSRPWPRLLSPSGRTLWGLPGKLS